MNAVEPRNTAFVYATMALALLLCHAAAAQTASDKEIYGQDDRIDVYQETDSERQAWAKSLCALMPADFLTDNGDNTYSIVPDATSYFPPLCADQAFADQPRGAECSAFMVGADLIA